MTDPWLRAAFDLVLALGAVLRLTRFVVADDVPGEWFIKTPLHNLKHRSQQRRAPAARVVPGVGVVQGTGPEPGWARYLEGLSCPFCVSVWMSAVVTVSLLLAGGPGDAADWWRWIAGFLTLAWLAGHIAAWTGDTEE